MPAVDTVIAAVVADVFHKYDVPPVAVNTVDVPEQMILLPVIAAVGNGLTVKARVAVAVQPAALVTVTVYVPAVDTVIAAVVAPVFHI